MQKKYQITDKSKKPSTQKTNAPNFDTVWTALQETDRILKENSVDFNKRLGTLTNLFGEFTESMMAPKLCDKFRELGIDFPKANPNAYVNDRQIRFFLKLTLC
jgi:hypothetical protein